MMTGVDAAFPFLFWRGCFQIPRITRINWLEYRHVDDGLSTTGRPGWACEEAVSYVLLDCRELVYHHSLYYENDTNSAEQLTQVEGGAK